MSAKYNGYVVIYGSNGVVGDTCTKKFKENNWWIGCINCWKQGEHFSEEPTKSTHSIVDPNDKRYLSEDVSKAGDLNILVDPNRKASALETEISEIISTALEGRKLDAVICLAGGYVMGNANEQLSVQTDLMWKQNVWPAVLATSIAVNFMKEGGFLCLPGAKDALNATPDTVAYGLSKAALHQLTISLGTKGSPLPQNSLCVGILLVTSDAARSTSETMPEAEMTDTTPAKYLSDMLLGWSNGNERPENGCIVVFNAKFSTEVSFLK